MYREYLPPDPEADALASWIEGLTEEEWNRLSEHVPAAIAEGEPAEFSELRPVSLQELRQASRL